MIDDTKLAEWQALCDAATPGPWHAESIGVGVRHLERNCEFYTEALPDNFRVPGRQLGDGGQKDGDFIAAARTALPDAVAEIRRLRALAAWRPIETAPRDGKGVLIGTVDDRVFAMTYSWEEWWERCGGHEESVVPTHWMPLPMPPEAP